MFKKNRFTGALINDEKVIILGTLGVFNLLCNVFICLSRREISSLKDNFLWHKREKIDIRNYLV